MKKVVKLYVNALVTSQFDYCNALYYDPLILHNLFANSAKYFSQASCAHKSLL